MDEDTEYASSMGLNLERGIALGLVVLWAVIAFFIGGPVLAMRAVLVFSFPLAFIWLPEVMAKLQASERHEGFRLEGGVMPAVMKWMGWFILLGVPAVWGIFWWAI
ncbi:hypothetical protein JIN84_10085 [Luteolibacter yonseiensis]|uniref:Transmembrane protein n=1 Tax=Luteolibacter yonseiensis TaxID=1144680 RepID=A0A934R4N9_9BACT|nr:hypothetical protein [Luteolibacter yonseiensis]MBK1815968.1 hypothetical protein [Luteolibacter yonseiensis]